MTTTTTPLAKYWFTDRPERRSNTGRTVATNEMAALLGLLSELSMTPEHVESRLDYAYAQLQMFMSQRGKCECCGSTDDGLTLGDLLYFMSAGWHTNWNGETE